MKVLVAILTTLLVAAGTAGAATLVTGASIKNGSVTGKDIRNHSLTRRDIKGPLPGTRPYVAETTVTFGAGEIDIVSAVCDPGDAVISGGWSMTAGVPFVDKSYDDTSWSVGVDNFDQGVSSDITVMAYCAPIGVATAANAGKRDDLIEKDLAAYRGTHTD